MNAPVTAVETDPFRVLVAWIQENLSLGDPVNDECYRAGLSADVHRCLKFGGEEDLNHLSARACMTCCLMCGGTMAEFFIRTAFTRALIEDEQEIVSRIAQSPFIPESRTWLAKLAQAFSGDDEKVAEVAMWIETMDGEERAIASLLLGRVFHDLPMIEWLTVCPTDYPRLPAEIALLLLKREEYHTVVKQYLREHPAVRFAIDDERWPIPL